MSPHDQSVPFLDLAAHHAPIKAELLAAFGEVIDRSAFAGGPYVEKFEREFAAYCGTGYTVGVGNGTDALWFALLALGIGPGDEVITVSHTFAATVEAILLAGATPVLIDVCSDTLNLDPELLASALSPRTKAIIPVHLYGRLADLDPILAFARQHGLKVIEDASQAHGAERGGKRAGARGDLGCFSFYPGKNLGGLGEAGAVVTHDATLAATLRSLREHGQSQRYHHERFGWNGRMDGLQAAALSIKLRRLDDANAARRARASFYLERLADTPGLVLPAPGEGDHVWHLFPVLTEARDSVQEQLRTQGIQTGIHYPIPLHRQPAYAARVRTCGSLRHTEHAAGRLLSLPLYPELDYTSIARVCTALRPVVQPAA